MSARKQQSPFRQELVHRRRIWQRSGQWTAVFRGLATFVLGVVVLAALDALLALPPMARGGLLLLWGLLCAGFVLTRITHWQRRSEKLFARYADQTVGYRKPVLSALESEESAAGTEHGPLADYLNARLVKEGRMALLLHPEDRCTRNPSFQRARRLALGAVGAVALIVIIAWPISQVVLPRLFAPWQDHPPYSAYTFAVQLPDEAVYYGNSARLSIDISGAPLREPVVLRTREPDGITERVAFQESPTRFMQEIENLTRDIEFSFATGRARTHWMRVPIRYEPRILLARLREVPPAYTDRPQRDTLIRDPRITGYQGTQLELSLASNRPLNAGQLRLITPDSGNHHTISAEISDGNLASFRWTLEEDAEIEVYLDDIRGTRSREPFLLTQILREDTLPEVAITYPPAYSLATRSSLLRLEGHAQDDLGLKQVNLWRGLGQFRDRPRPLALPASTRYLAINEALPLDQIGVASGDVLAFHLQARDTRPGSGGTISSNQVHIEIIDEETYAELLRRQLTIDDFSRKMEATSKALQAVAEAAEALREAMESGAEPETIEALHEAFAEALQEAAQLMEKFSGDFPIYAIEERAREAWTEAAESLAQQIDLLDGLRHDPEAPAVLASIRDHWRGPAADALNELQEESEHLSSLNTFMQRAADISKIITAQEELVRSIDHEINQPGGASPDELRHLGQRQERLRQQLEATVEAIRQQAALNQQHPELAAMCQSALEMADLIDTHQISGDMAQAATAGQSYRPQAMHQHATQALQNLERLLQDCSGSEFGGMCNGSQNFSIPRLDRTLSQMMNTLFAPDSSGRGGRGMGFGIGGGRGAGMGAHGAWGHTASPMGVPVYGPQRSGYSPHAQSHPSGIQGGNEGPGGQGHGSGQAARIEAGDSIAASPAERGPREAIHERTVPERYRDAARRYFDLIDEIPTP